VSLGVIIPELWLSLDASGFDFDDLIDQMILAFVLWLIHSIVIFLSFRK